MKDIVCNFAIARFRPYRETGEFVNVGIVLLCPQLGFFNYCFEKRKHKRITDFFPELEFEVFKAGLSGLMKELGRLTEDHRKGPRQLVFGSEIKNKIAAFQELVRPREAIFHFSDIGTVTATDPEAKLTELFDFYVKRQFARDREYQEIIMKRKLADFLQKADLSRFYKQDQKIGNDTYHITIPFVSYLNDKPRKAIKPLHLDKETPTEIYRHGDFWISTVRRLRHINCLPQEFLFTLKSPVTGEKCRYAADEICNELKKLEILIAPFADKDSILNFASG